MEDITVYTQPNCPGCITAKAALRQQGKLFTEIEIGKDISASEFKELHPGVRTVPFIYIKTK
jgi:glutaredoxin